MHTLKSRYAPGDYVTVAFVGLGYPGRVSEVKWSQGEVTYLITYAANGELRSGEYSEDELEPHNG